jgi:excisionase family DNA binding protein
MPPPLLSVEEAAEITQTCTKWIRTQIAAGRLRAHRFGRMVRIAPEDLAAFIRSHRD